MSRKLANGTKVRLLQGLRTYLKNGIESDLWDALQIIMHDDANIQQLHQGECYEAARDWLLDLVIMAEKGEI